MIKVQTQAVVLAISLFSGCAFASDVMGKSWIGGGVGGVECPEVVKFSENTKSLPTGSLAYVREIHPYAMFLAGFQTAYNLQTPNTCDIFAGLSTEQLLAWTVNHCRQKPLDKFGPAVIALARELHPQRGQLCK